MTSAAEERRAADHVERFWGVLQVLKMWAGQLVGVHPAASHAHGNAPGETHMQGPR